MANSIPVRNRREVLTKSGVERIHYAALDVLEKADALAKDMASTPDIAKLQEIGTERLRYTIKAASLYRRENNHRGEAVSYIIAVSICLLLKSRSIASTGKQSYVSMVVDYCDKAAAALRESGSLRLSVKGLSRINEYLKLFYAMSDNEMEKAAIEKAIAGHAASFISNICLLNRMEREGIKMAEQSAKLYAFASGADDENVRKDMLKTARILDGCSARNLYLTGNYRLLDDTDGFLKKYRFNDEANDKVVSAVAGSGVAINEATYSEDKRPTASGNVCPTCNTRYEPGDRFCVNCGFDLKAALMICPHCNSELQADDMFCPNCGRRSTSA